MSKGGSREAAHYNKDALPTSPERVPLRTVASSRTVSVTTDG